MPEKYDVPKGIGGRLEDVPEDIKTVFRVIQNREETEEIEDGDFIALYNSDSNGREEHRWIKMGRYDETDDEVRIEYIMNYDTSTERITAELNFATRTPGEYGSRPVKVPEEIYEDVSETIHEAF